jgi:hypothetical protein
MTFPKLKKEDGKPKQLGDLSNKISKDFKIPAVS